MSAEGTSWTRHEWVGSAQEFHELELPVGRGVWSCVVESPSIILGSTQSASDVDESIAQLLGLSVAKRHSGGGAVFVHPADSIWIDITIGRDDPLWVDDVSASMLWAGEAFVRALSPWVNGSVYTGAFESGHDGRTVCFASTSPGEVFVNGHKLVGISQRRGRNGARLQCMLYRQWNPRQWTPALIDPTVRQRTDEMSVATVDMSPQQMLDALISHLP
jgi:lipoate-protein ligase A